LRWGSAPYIGLSVVTDWNTPFVAVSVDYFENGFTVPFHVELKPVAVHELANELRPVAAID